MIETLLQSVKSHIPTRPSSMCTQQPDHGSLEWHFSLLGLSHENLDNIDY